MTAEKDFAPLRLLAARLGVTLGPTEQERLAGYAELLAAWNARINLTGAESAEVVVRDHLPDAIALASIVPASSQVVDLGSGGGLPAVPLALLRPDCRVEMVEPRSKRVAFLRAALRTLGVENASVFSGRIEPGDERPAEVAEADFAVSRATYAPEIWLPLGRSLVRPGGLVAVLAAARRDLEGLGPFEREVTYALADGRSRTLRAYR